MQRKSAMKNNDKKLLLKMYKEENERFIKD